MGRRQQQNNRGAVAPLNQHARTNELAEAISRCEKPEGRESLAKIPAPLARLTDALRTRGYVASMRQAYVDWARRVILFHGKRHP